jgi:hypothetical protein
MFPVGLGIGATHVAWFVMSPTRAAGILPMSTVIDPFIIMPGPAGTHDGNTHGTVMSVIRAAGIPPIKTFGCPLMMARGRAGCGTGVGTGAGGWIGA